MAAFVGVAALHVAFVWLLTTQLKPRPVSREVSAPESLAIFFVPRAVEALPSAVPRNVRARMERSRARPDDAPERRDDSASADSTSDSSAITVERAIDWAQEAERAAARFAEAGEEPGREGMGFPRREETPVKPPVFGWSRSRTHRIEEYEGVPIGVWLSDRCFLASFLIPMCKVGKIEPNGGLFDPMDDAPVMGDWKDP